MDCLERQPSSRWTGDGCRGRFAPRGRGEEGPTPRLAGAADHAPGACLFAALFLAGLLVVAMVANFAHGSFAVEFLFQAAEGPFDGFAFLDFNFGWHGDVTPGNVF